MVERDSKQKDSREPLDEECGQPRGAEINPQLIANKERGASDLQPQRIGVCE